jgi:hypothetical protein
MQRSITFRLKPDVAKERVAEVVRMGVQKIAMQALRGIVLRTPVDTGRARSNWNVSLGTPDLTEQDPTSPADVLAVGESTIAEAPAIGIIYISNGLPYIERLEAGYSKQAPAGMVRLTLDQIAAQFE